MPDGDRFTHDAVMLALTRKQCCRHAGFPWRLGRYEHLAADDAETNKNGFGRIAVSSLGRRDEPVHHSDFGIDCIHHRHERVRRPRLPRACRQARDLGRSCDMFRHVIGR